MRKKFIKSSRPTYKKRIKKAQQGMRFVSYNPVSNPTIDYTDITNPINPFSEYNYNTTYDKPEALVVPVRDTNEPDVVANNPTAEPVINKLVNLLLINLLLPTQLGRVHILTESNGLQNLLMPIRRQVLLMIMQLECY